MLWAILTAILGLVLVPIIFLFKLVWILVIFGILGLLALFNLSPYAFAIVLGIIGLWLILSYYNTNAKD
ncbi:hypothetical protein [Helicobacter rodentium]|uniref:hypothetical protein n=1 Tax=Helicobacter rodentium TaxID=59617 RepID=UPI00047A59AC|nr:hypothetical protein [Helicobacter rodentium]